MLDNRSQSIPLTTSDPGTAVNRETEVTAFSDVLDRIILQRPGTTPVFEWYGGPGIGKSTLVRELLIPECSSRAVPWVLVDFRQRPVPDFVTDPTLLLEAILVDLSQHARVRVETANFQEKLAIFRSGGRPPEIIRAYFEMSPEDRLYRSAHMAGCSPRRHSRLHSCDCSSWPGKNQPIPPCCAVLR